jgi:hypothetical protein
MFWHPVNYRADFNHSQHGAGRVAQRSIDEWDGWACVEMAISYARLAPGHLKEWANTV